MAIFMLSIVWVYGNESARWGWPTARKVTVRLAVMDEGGRDDV